MIAPRRPPVLLLGDTLAMGGTERQLTEIACGLASSGWDVRVACLRAEGPLRAKLEEAGIEPWSFGAGSLKSPAAVRGIWTLARHIRRQRIGLVHSFDIYSNVYGVLAGRLARTATVIASQRDLGNLRPPAQQRVNRMMLRLAHYVLANSKAAAAGVGLSGRIRRERLVVVPNGVDAARFGALERVSDGRPIRVFGTVSNLRPEKGLTDLVRAAALLHGRYPDIRLVIWGEGSLRRELETLIGSFGLSHVVQLPGHTHDTAKSLSALDAFILPSLSESCSNSLMEAMAVGLPVIASNTGGNPELVVDGASGLLVRPGDPADLARAMANMMDDPAGAAALGSRAARRARSDFSLAAMLAGIEALYESALAGGRALRLPAAPDRAA